jgi:hypothetical protein
MIDINEAKTTGWKMTT